jgi:hypothetical protein
MIQTERIEERDLVAMGMLRSLGIEKGKPFAPSDKMVAMFDAAAKEYYPLPDDHWGFSEVTKS